MMNGIELHNKNNEVVKIFNHVKKHIMEDSISEIIADNILGKEAIEMGECCFFKLKSLTYDDKYPHREAFENVLATIDNAGFNFVYLLSGNPEGIDIYIGIVRNYNYKDSIKVNAVEYGKMLEAAFKGNFQGSELERLFRSGIQNQIIDKLKAMEKVSLITGIPSVNKSGETKDVDFQGIDRLINSMSGVNWHILIVCEPAVMTEVYSLKENIYNLYERLQRQSKISLQQSENNSYTESDSTSKGDSYTKNIGVNDSRTTGGGESNSSSSGKKTTSSNYSDTKGTNRGTSEGKTSSDTKGTSTTDGTSKAITIEMVNKEVQETLKYIDEDMLERIKIGNSKGLFKTAVYALAEDANDHERLKSSVLSIFQGDKSAFSPLKSRLIGDSYKDIRPKLLCNFQNYMTRSNLVDEVAILHGHPAHRGYVGLSTYMTAGEVSLIAGLPLKEVPGLALKEGIEFGLNMQKQSGEIKLGSIINRGQVLHSNILELSKKNLNKHVFIAGVTGSGKTTTCQKLLIESKLPFMVIEPAKTEYRGLLGEEDMEDLTIFTLGNEKLSPFRLNPFELLEGESITGHVDMLKATFTAAFPMEAAMPQILEASIYKCYEEFGWNIEDDTNRYCSDPWKERGTYFPTMEDLVGTMKSVVKEQGFGAELRDNYIGSLVSRVSNLTIGAKGQMLNCKLSIDFNSLLDEKVIIEMEAIKSPEDKALLMGLILSRMSEVLKLRHKKQKDFMHITLVEEAHRLLSKIEYGDSGSKKIAVEMFTDMLAEVRKYGESLIIVDQIPNKLAVEVLKNTNTKIIHRIFAKDDKEVIGDTMLMDDKQKQSLSSLDIGEAIVFTEGTHKPVHVKIKMATDTGDNDLEDDILKHIGLKQKQKYLSSFNPLMDRLNLNISYYKSIIGVCQYFRDIIGLLQRESLQLEAWKEFISKMSSFAEQSNIELRNLWEELVREYIIQDSILKENQFNESKLFSSFESLYYQLENNFENIDTNDEKFSGILL